MEPNPAQNIDGSRRTTPGGIASSGPAFRSLMSAPAVSLPHTGGVMEQLIMLQQRHAQLEFEAVSLAEDSQRTIIQNKNNLLALKQENKELLAQVSGNRVAGRPARVSAGGGAAAAAAAEERVQREVNDLRAAYDKMMQAKRSSLARLEKLQDSVEGYARSAGSASSAAAHDSSPSVRSSSASVVSTVSSDNGGHSHGGHGGAAAGSHNNGIASREIRVLVNRLDKASVKGNEAHCIRKTYEQVVERLKRERPLLNAQLTVMEGTLVATRAELEAIAKTARTATLVKEAAKAELSEAESKLASERATRRAQLEGQRGEAREMHASHARPHANPLESIDASHADRASSTSTITPSTSGDAATASRRSAAGAMGTVRESEGQGPVDGSGYWRWGWGQQQQQQQPTLQSLLGTIQAAERLADVAAADSAGGVFEVLAAQQATSVQLGGMLAAGATRWAKLASLQATYEQLCSHADDMRSGGWLSTQLQLDAAQAEFAEAMDKADRARELHDCVLRSYVGVRAGLEHLQALVAPLPLAQPPLPLEDDLVGDVLGQCEARLVAAYKFIQTLPKAAELLNDLSTHPDYTFSIE
ncbi:MAG: hypothetical protein WDW38_008730 [Sanguina aurantia]